ncbi:MAG: hypothetical protein AB7V39_11890 [Nitrospiraceae bacterium]
MVQVVDYWRNGEYHVRFPDGLWDGETVVFHHTELRRVERNGAERNT